MPSSTHPVEDRPSGAKPFWEDAHLQLWGGDCRAVLAELPAESVHCVVTSPPYWGLRDYGTATWDGGDAACDHRIGRTMGNANKGAVREVLDGDRSACSCGATRIDSQLGLEPTPEAYVANMVDVFREVRRVMRPDATLWLNLGDSYASHDPGGYRPGEHLNPGGRPAAKGSGRNRAGAYVERGGGLKPKDLVGIPWRTAFALQADGWYLRSDIIWSKPNPMPESVTDRPTKAHEYLFLLSKSPRYYFDAEAVRERANGSSTHDLTGPGYDAPGQTAQRGNRGSGNLARKFGEDRDRPGSHLGASVPWDDNGQGRNLRTVWTIATEPYPGAHFATFPRKLVDPCVKAGTSERGVCLECGAPWVRETGRDCEGCGTLIPTQAKSCPDCGRVRDWKAGRSLSADMVATDWSTPGRGTPRLPGGFVNQTRGEEWRPSCAHGAEPVPATVLDPFAGSGTTLLVAQALGRKGIGIDLSPEYLQQALARNAQTPLGLVG